MPRAQRGTNGGRPEHTTSCASSAAAAATCIRGSSAMRPSSREGWPQSSRSMRRTALSTTSSERPGSRRSPPRASPPTGRSISAASNGSSRRTASPGTAAVRGGSRAVWPRAGGLAERAARRVGRRRPRSRALRNGRTQGPPKHKLGMARRSLDTRLRTRVAARAQSIGLRPRPWRCAALPRLAVRVLRVALAGCFDADDIPEVHRNPLRCARAALAQDDRHADPAEQT